MPNIQLQFIISRDGARPRAGGSGLRGLGALYTCEESSGHTLWNAAGTAPDRHALWNAAGTAPDQHALWNAAGTAPDHHALWNAEGTAPDHHALWNAEGTAPDQHALWNTEGTALGQHALYNAESGLNFNATQQPEDTTTRLSTDRQPSREDRLISKIGTPFQTPMVDLLADPR